MGPGPKRARVELHAEAAVGELLSKRGGTRIAEAELSVTHLGWVLGWNVHPDFHPLDAAALDTLVRLGAGI